MLPRVPVRQWVLSLPKRLSPYLPHDRELIGAILRVLLRAIETRLRRTSPAQRLTPASAPSPVCTASAPP